MTQTNTGDDTTRSAKPDRATKTIAIFGGYSAPPGGQAYKLAYDIGHGLASAGFEVLNGGYDGTMKAASKGAKDAGGTTIGITCPSVIKNVDGELPPNKFLDEIQPAPDLMLRINEMMRLCGGFVVLDGGTGTLAELAIVWEFVSKGFIPSRPIVLAGRAWDGLVRQMNAHRPSSTKQIHRADDAATVVAILQEHAVSGTRIRRQGQPSQPLNDTTTTVALLREMVDRFVEERDWQPFHDPKNLSASIAIEASELMEHFQWLRTDQLDEVLANQAKMGAIREEIADVLAYVLSFADTMNIDLSSALTDKLKKNALKYPVDMYRGRFE